jgi:hypothetical protein
MMLMFLRIFVELSVASAVTVFAYILADGKKKPS